MNKSKQTLLIALIVITASLVMAGCLDGDNDGMDVKYPITSTFTISEESEYGSMKITLNRDKSVSMDFRNMDVGHAEWRCINRTDNSSSYLITTEGDIYNFDMVIYRSGYATWSNEGSTHIGLTGEWE